MTQHAFTITIHCEDKNSQFTQERSTAAPNDILARDLVVKKFLAEYRGYAKSDVPTVLFCEVTYLAKLS